jgi:hypothetical protein
MIIVMVEGHYGKPVNMQSQIQWVRAIWNQKLEMGYNLHIWKFPIYITFYEYSVQQGVFFFTLVSSDDHIKTIFHKQK